MKCLESKRLIAIMNIIIDTKGQASLIRKSRLVESDDDDLDFENNGNSAFHRSV